MITRILNGDALLLQLETIVSGNKIVCRECMIEGPKEGNELDTFFKNRAVFFQNQYKISNAGYKQKSQQELFKIKDIPEDDEINLWFEDDLFCQSNFWFIAHLIKCFGLTNRLFLVRPSHGNEYNFGNMSANELKSVLKEKTEITIKELSNFQNLWSAYCRNDSTEMISLARQLNTHFPFVEPAVYASISISLGIPKKKLAQIINKLNTKEFAPVFLEFCKQEPIYGFGDLQVKHMFDEIIKQNE